MKVILDSNFSIEVIPLNYVLIENRVSRKGNEGEVNRYFKDMESALARYLDLTRKEKTADFEGDARKYIEEIKRINAETLDKLILKVEKEVEKNG